MEQKSTIGVQTICQWASQERRPQSERQEVWLCGVPWKRVG